MVEADLERFFAENKDDFVGKEATLEVKKNGIVTKLVYVEVQAADSDMHGGEPALVNGRAIGVTTSGGYGHYTGKSLGFVYVEPEFSEPGSQFHVDLLGKPYKATVLAEPVWDPANERLRA